MLFKKYRTYLISQLSNGWIYSATISQRLRESRRWKILKSSYWVLPMNHSGSNEIVVFEGFEVFPALQEIHIGSSQITQKTIRSMISERPSRWSIFAGSGWRTTPASNRKTPKPISSFSRLFKVNQSQFVAKSKGIDKPQEGCSIYWWLHWP